MRLSRPRIAPDRPRPALSLSLSLSLFLASVVAAAVIARSIDHRLFKDVSDTEGTKTETRREEGREDGEKERGRERGCNFRERRGRKEGRSDRGWGTLAGRGADGTTNATDHRPSDRPTDGRRPRTTKTWTKRKRERGLYGAESDRRERERERERGRRGKTTAPRDGGRERAAARRGNMQYEPSTDMKEMSCARA